VISIIIIVFSMRFDEIFCSVCFFLAGNSHFQRPDIVDRVRWRSQNGRTYLGPPSSAIPVSIYGNIRTRMAGGLSAAREPRPSRNDVFARAQFLLFHRIFQSILPNIIDKTWILRCLICCFIGGETDFIVLLMGFQRFVVPTTHFALCR
jgi:hypothetical protein